MSADSHILSSISYVQCIDFSTTQLKMVHEFGDLAILSQFYYKEIYFIYIPIMQHQLYYLFIHKYHTTLPHYYKLCYQLHKVIDI